MTDYCSKCYCKGNYKRCSETPCHHHESWVGMVRVGRIKNLEKKLESITCLCAEGVEFMTRTELASAVLKVCKG